MAKKKDDVEEPITDSSESSTSDSDSDAQDKESSESSRKFIEDNTNDILGNFKLSCLHGVDETVLSAALRNYQQASKLHNRESLPQKSIVHYLRSDFTPWWEEFTKPDKSKPIITLASQPQTDGDTYDSWFNKNQATESIWLSGPSQSSASALPSQTSKVEDISVPSIYDNKPAPKGRRALKRERKAEREKTLGKKWFGMKRPDVDEKLKNDMELIQMRSVLDPKRFYKHRDRKGLPKYFQMGTVVDEGTDFYSSRLTKKQRKQTLVEELMADANIRRYNKKKYAELQQKMRGKKNIKSKKSKH